VRKWAKRLAVHPGGPDDGIRGADGLKRLCTGEGACDSRKFTTLCGGAGDPCGYTIRLGK